MEANMNKYGKLLLMIMLFFMIVISILPATAYANSAEPPSLVILVNNPPDDLSIVLESDKNQNKAMVRRVAWEGYFVFYSREMQAAFKYNFKVTTNGESFECTINEPLQRANTVYTLDLSNRKLTPGKYPFRSVLLVSIRLILTLLIEGIIFWLFGYSEKRSWLIFLIINLITQGALNIWLDNVGMQMSGYLIFILIFGEIFVFAAEMIAFLILIKEHKKIRTLIYTFTANLVSLIVGGYIITVLPI